MTLLQACGYSSLVEISLLVSCKLLAELLAIADLIEHLSLFFDLTLNLRNLSRKVCTKLDWRR